MADDDGAKIPSFNPHVHRLHHHHHHHIFYASHYCPLHRSILQPNNHSPSCSFATTYLYPQNPPHPQLSCFHPNQTFHDSQMIEDENEKLEDEQGEEEDPVYVLTDEWREFFAKSEAKRRLAKKQAKKGKK